MIVLAYSIQFSRFRDECCWPLGLRLIGRTTSDYAALGNKFVEVAHELRWYAIALGTRCADAIERLFPEAEPDDSKLKLRKSRIVN
jgi:hypothetical protein